MTKWRTSWLRWKLGVYLHIIAWALLKKSEDMCSPDDPLEQSEVLDDLIGDFTGYKSIATECPDGTLTIHLGYQGHIEKR
jgi:hypothetical protein